MRNAPSITLYSMYSSNAHREKPGGSVCTTYNVRQHCHSKQFTVTVQCLWHRHVAVHSIYISGSARGTNMRQYTACNISGSAHGTNMQQYTAYNISGSTHDTNMRQYTAYNISSSAHGTNMWQYIAYNTSGSAHGTNMWQYTAYNISSSAISSAQHIV